MRFVLGIDPGLTGALALYDPITGGLEAVIDMPATTRGGKNELDPYLLSAFISTHAKSIRLVALEDVSAMKYTNAAGKVRGQGAAASFAFGKYFGVVVGVLAANHLPILFVKPAVWKMGLGLSSRKEDSLRVAREKFAPHSALFALKKHDGRAEAALLAFYAAERLR